MQFAKKMVFILLFVSSFLPLFEINFALADGIQWEMLVGGVNGAWNEGTDLQNDIFRKIQEILFTVATVVVIGMLVYAGFRLFSAKGNADEYKKAWTAIIYIAVGLAVLPLAYVAVKIVSGFQ